MFTRSQNPWSSYTKVRRNHPSNWQRKLTGCRLIKLVSCSKYQYEFYVDTFFKAKPPQFFNKRVLVALYMRERTEGEDKAWKIFTIFSCVSHPSLKVWISKAGEFNLNIYDAGTCTASSYRLAKDLPKGKQNDLRGSWASSKDTQAPSELPQSY